MTREQFERAEKIGARIGSWVKGMIWMSAGFTFGWVATEAITHGVGLALLLTIATGVAVGEIYYHQLVAPAREQARQLKEAVSQWVARAEKSQP